MKVTEHIEDEGSETPEKIDDAESRFLRLLDSTNQEADVSPFGAVVVGELFVLRGDERIPMVLYPGQLGSAPVMARSAIDLSGAHIGKPVVLVFEGSDPAKPIIIGVLREHPVVPVQAPATAVEVQVDGERLLIEAREQLVLRCGRASVTLTKAGKVLIQGEYVSTRSAGVNRIKGGSVQIN